MKGKSLGGGQRSFAPGRAADASICRDLIALPRLFVGAFVGTLSARSLHREVFDVSTSITALFGTVYGRGHATGAPAAPAIAASLSVFFLVAASLVYLRESI